MFIETPLIYHCLNCDNTFHHPEGWFIELLCPFCMSSNIDLEIDDCDLDEEFERW